MLETLAKPVIEFTSGRLEQPGLIPTDLREIITKVHPHLIDTGLPEVATKLFLALKSLTKYDKKQYDHPEAFGLIRGSLIKRHLLGDPEGFLDIPNFFSSFAQSLDISETPEFTQKTVQKLSEGPIEIDGRFVFRKNKQQQVLLTLIKSLMDQGFSPNKSKAITFTNGRFQAKIETIIIDKDTDDPKPLYHVKFFENEKVAFNIDIYNLPDEKIYGEELRLSHFASFFEMCSTAEMITENNGISVLIDPSLVESQYSPKGGLITHFQESATDAFGHLLRLVGGRVFWPVKNIVAQLENTVLTRSDMDIISNANHGFDTERKKLEQRQETLVSDLLLYLTYDPFLFLFLGFETHLLDHTLLGDFLKTEGELSALIKTMAEELIGQDADGNINLSYLSNAYKKLVLKKQPADIKKTGGFMLLRALNKLNNVSQKENLTNIIILLNPYLKYFPKNQINSAVV